MIVATTLVSFACLVSQGASLDQLDPGHTLTDHHRSHIQTMAEKGACLPQSFEARLIETNYMVQTGELDLASLPPNPTEECSSPTRL